MAFPESILIYQQTTAKALNQTHTRLKMASSTAHPFLWRGKSTCVNQTEAQS